MLDFAASFREHHVGLGRARPDRVHTDAVRSEFERGGLREPDDRELARRVRAEIAEREHGRFGRDVDDPTARPAAIIVRAAACTPWNVPM